jgi:hypothetical protein
MSRRSPSGKASQAGSSLALTGGSVSRWRDPSVLPSAHLFHARAIERCAMVLAAKEVVSAR